MSEAAAQSAPSASAGYRRYVLAILVLIYTSNFIDRTILGTLAQPIKEDLRLSDGQIGLLGGMSFALLYSTLGLPAARLAERKSRVAVMTGALTVWSAMTALCGLAANFWQLMLMRIGVGIGEAGCIPPANSLIADYFPPNKRATASGIFSLGVPLGAIAGALIGSAIAQTWGWRTAFVLVGLPGLALALLFRLTVREPPRGVYDPPGADEAAPSIVQVAKKLAGKPTFLHLAFAASLASFAGYGINTFAIPFLLRGFDVTLVQAAGAFALFGGVAAAIGVGSGGFIADWAAKHDRRFHVLIPAGCFLVASPLYMLAFSQQSLAAIAGLVVAPAILQYIYLGPIFGLPQNMVGPRERAATAAILTLIINLIGMGLGPTLIGWVSDLNAASAFTGPGAYAQSCPGGVAIAGVDPEACRRASFLGLQRALVTSAGIYVWAALHFFLASRTLKRDVES